jgi:hypothetical protein
MPSFPSTQYVQKASEYRKACPNSAVAASVKARKPSTSAHDDCSNDENNFRASFPLIRHTCVRARTNREYKAEVQMQKFQAVTLLTSKGGNGE